MFRIRAATLAVLLFVPCLAMAWEHRHPHQDVTSEPPPRIFLDKSPRIVAYQLKRLSNARLLQVERSTDDVKYKPIYEAILKRAGMSTASREEAIAALAKLTDRDPILVVLDALESSPRPERRAMMQLGGMILAYKPTELQQREDVFKTLALNSDEQVVRSIGYAALLAAGRQETALQAAEESDEGRLDLLGGVVMTRQAKTRNQLRNSIVEWTKKGQDSNLRRAAIGALGYLTAGRTQTFDLVAAYFDEPALRTAAVKTMLRIPSANREAETARALLNKLVEFAEQTPAAKRTTDSFVDAMQLADQLMAKAPVAEARSLRQRLRAVTVRVVRINTVEEEMRYDVPFFAVEAGRPVQILLNNEDLMPHNLVITQPGALREVATEGAAAGPEKQYLPESEKVLFATGLVPARQHERLTFTAPTEPGEYPFVCTFPRHWMRMYGVMVVVEDLDAYAQNPITPEDPIGNNRSFVKNWTIEDFSDKVEQGIRGRNAEIGAKLFTEATCAQCHKMHGKGGAVGPELTDVLKRWKGNRVGVLREILDPSHKVDPKYAVRLIATEDGKVVSGVVVAEDDDSMSVVANPEDPKPIRIEKDTIEEVIESTKSLMPKALLDRYTEDEIFELLAYIIGASGDGHHHHSSNE